MPRKRDGRGSSRALLLERGPTPALLPRPGRQGRTDLIVAGKDAPRSEAKHAPSRWEPRSRATARPRRTDPGRVQRLGDLPQRRAPTTAA
jgi:hypothetical protein